MRRTALARGPPALTVAYEILIGTVGTVVRAVRGGRMPGEVRILDGGEPTLLMAYSEQPLDEGTRVRVVHSRGSRQVDVAPWP